MLNRIRRAVSHTRARYFTKGRHRRPLTPSPPPTAPAFSAPADEPTVPVGAVLDCASRRYSITGEDVAFVRPYVLAWEGRVRRHRAAAVPSPPPADAWSASPAVC